MHLINVGFDNFVSARDRGALIDTTQGRRTRAAVIMDSAHVVLSAVQPETIARRLGNKDEITG